MSGSVNQSLVFAAICAQSGSGVTPQYVVRAQWGDDSKLYVEKANLGPNSRLFPDDSLAWQPVTPDPIGRVLRVFYFQKGSPQRPCLVIDCVPDDQQIRFWTIDGHAESDRCINFSGTVPSILECVGAEPTCPIIDLEIALAGGRSPFGPDGYPVFTSGSVGYYNTTLNHKPIPSPTPLMNLAGMVFYCYCEKATAPQLAVTLGLTVVPAASSSYDWHQMIQLGLVKTQDGTGLRLRLARWIELADPNHTAYANRRIIADYYNGPHGLSIDLVNPARSAQPDPTKPPTNWCLRLVQEQPADLISVMDTPAGTPIDFLTGISTLTAGSRPAWDVIVEGISYQSIAKLWNETVARPYYLAIRVAAESQPISAIPFWQEAVQPLQPSPPTIGTPIYALRFALDQWDSNAKPNNGPKIKIRPKRLHLAQDIGAQNKLVDISSGGDSFSTGIQLPGLIAHDGNPLAQSVGVETFPPPAKVAWWETNECGVAIAEFKPGIKLPASGTVLGSWFLAAGRPPVTLVKQTVRVGALDLTFADCWNSGPIPGNSGRSCFSISAEFEVFSLLDVNSALVRIQVGGLSDSYFKSTLSVLPLVGVAAAGQDPTEGAEYIPANRNSAYARPPSLVFSTSSGTAGAPGGEGAQLLINVTESTGDPSGNDWQSPLVTLHILSPRGLPDFGRVIVLDPAPFLVAAVDAKLLAATDTAEIAVWTNDPTEGASWQLALDGAGIQLRLPPQTVGETLSKGPKTPDLQPDALSDLRFSPVALATMGVTAIPKRLVEAPWNLRRRLGFPGQSSPGTELNDLRFELLYGLEIELNSPKTMLAEMQSRLGMPAGPMDPSPAWGSISKDQNCAYQHASQDWATVCRLLDRRLGFLELWSPLIDGDFHVESDVNYTQRPLALKQLLNPFATAADDKLLAGGWNWGFESPNIYAAVTRSPNSTSGELARPALSALGGWGWQKARFDEDRTSVIANTTMGRPEFYSIERIGRIGVFWNKAKHVIVYERTVLQQNPEFSRPGLDGRPVLRKVKEYVEILEPLRSYPDDGSGNGLAMGFIEAMEFPKQNNANPKIPVNSSWGGDVRNVGWQVPLWRQGADEAIYPKPHVLVHMSAVPNSGSDDVAIEIASPDMLRFYTSTVQGAGADPDKWPSVEGIDYLDRPLPDLVAVSRLDVRNLDGMLPSAPPVPPGFADFAFPLIPGTAKANITANRSTTPIGAVPRNLVATRSKPASGPSATSAQYPAWNRASRMSGASGNADGLYSAIQTAIAAAAAKFNPNTLLSAAIGSITTAVTTAANNFDSGQYTTLLNDVTTDFANLAHGDAEKFKYLTQLPCDALQSRASTLIDTTCKSITDQANTLKSNLLQATDAIALQGGKFQEAATAQLNDLMAQIAQAPSPIGGALDQASAVVNAAGAAVDGVIADANDAHASFIERLGAIDDSVKGWEALVQNEVDGFFGQIGSVLNAAEALVRKIGQQQLSALQSGAMTLSAQLEAVRSQFVQMTGAITVAQQHNVAAVASATDTAFDNFMAPLNQVKAIVENFKSVLDTIQDPDNPDNPFTKAQAALYNGLQSISDAIEQQIDVSQGAAEFKSKINAAWSSALNEVMALRDTLQTETKKAIDTNICNLFDAAAQSWIDQCNGLAGAFGAGANQAAARISAMLTNLASTAGLTVGDAIPAINTAMLATLNAVRADIDQVAERVGSVFKQQFPDIDGFFSGTPTCALSRVLAEAPTALFQDINRDLVGLGFSLDVPQIDITPVAVLVDRLGDDLKSLGIRLPCVQMLDGFLPPDLKINPDLAVDLGTLLPDFSGLKLDGLFSSVGLPDLTTNNVKVSHGVDIQTRRAWVEADVDITMDPDIPVLSWEVLELRLQDSRFTAQSRINVSASGGVQRSANGKITGNWALIISGAALVTFEETALTFDDGGHISYHISPDKIVMSGGLSFLTDLMDEVKSFVAGLSDAGVTIRLLQEGGLPVGAEALLDLPLPPLDFGTFGIANVDVSGALGFGALPDITADNSGDTDFGIRLAFSLASEEEPFTLSVFVLGGGGWVDASCTYFPTKGKMVTAVTVSIGVTARLGIDLGVASGSLELYFGVAATFSSSGSSTAFSLAIVFVMDGSAVVLDIITVDVNLTLEAVYSGGSVTGYGTLRVRAQLGPFYKISVDKAVQQQLAGSGGSTHSDNAAVQRAVSDYHDQLED